MPNHETRVISIRFPARDFALIQADADRTGANISQYIRQAAYVRAIFALVLDNASLLEARELVVAAIEAGVQVEDLRNAILATAEERTAKIAHTNGREDIFTTNGKAVTQVR